MNSVLALERLLKVVTAARIAEEARLAAALARIAEVRGVARAAKQGLAAQAPAGPDPADLAATAAWCERLSAETRAAEARVTTLMEEARPLRQAVSVALGRETAAKRLLSEARARARAAAERRADLAMPLQSSSSEGMSSVTGSPGIA